MSPEPELPIQMRAPDAARYVAGPHGAGGTARGAPGTGSTVMRVTDGNVPTQTMEAASDDERMPMVMLSVRTEPARIPGASRAKEGIPVRRYPPVDVRPSTRTAVNSDAFLATSGTRLRKPL